MSRARPARTVLVALALATTSTLGAPAVAQATSVSKPAPATARTTRNVAIIVHEGVELLDFAGPGEVFEAASRRGAGDGAPWFRVYTVAPSAGEIVSQGFVRIVPEYTIESCPKPDILVIPGGRTGVLTGDEAFMSWVRATAPERELTMTVCTGAFVLGQSGLLDGLEVTTHWGAIDGLRQAAPNATVRHDRRVLDNDRIVTTAGVSAGIDGALHVVARLLGRVTADQVARGMEYRWTPEAAYASTYADLNPQLDEAGQALQQATIHRDRGEWAAVQELLADLVRAHPDLGEAWYLYGFALHAQGLYELALPAHRKAATFPRYRQRALYNAACAYALTGEDDAAIATLEAAIDAGFSNRQWAENDADFMALRSDPRFRALLDRMGGS